MNLHSETVKNLVNKFFNAREESNDTIEELTRVLNLTTSKYMKQLRYAGKTGSNRN